MKPKDIAVTKETTGVSHLLAAGWMWMESVRKNKWEESGDCVCKVIKMSEASIHFLSFCFQFFKQR